MLYKWFGRERGIGQIGLLQVFKDEFHTCLVLRGLFICDNLRKYLPLIALILIGDFIDKLVVHLVEVDVRFLLYIPEHRLDLIVIHDLKALLVGAGAP